MKYFFFSSVFVLIHASCFSQVNFSNLPVKQRVEDTYSTLLTYPEMDETAFMVTDLPHQLSNPIQKSSFDLETIEHEHILKVYKHFKENKRQTAGALGISMNTLKSKLDKTLKYSMHS